MADGFQITPSAVHEHAARTQQRGDRVAQTGSQAGSAGLSGNALGEIGGGTASRQQGLVDRVSSAFSQTGSRLQGHADLLNRSADSTTRTDSEHAGRFRSIHPSSSTSRTPQNRPDPAG